MKTLKVSSRSALAFFAAAAASCGDGGDSLAEDTIATQSALFVKPGDQLWNGASVSNPGPLGTGALVTVCFSVRPRKDANGMVFCPNQTSANVDCDGNAVPNVASLRQMIRTGIERTWVRYANLSIEGWIDCPIVNDSGTERHLERNLGRTVMIQLKDQDFTFYQDGVSNTRPTVVQYNWPAIVQFGVGNVVHEMGHALGFEDEWHHANFSDSRCVSTQGDPTHISGGMLMSPFVDPLSTMTCPELRPGGFIVTLSPGDIIGIQRAYGRKSTGSLVGFDGMCANINGGLTAPGTPIIAFPCTNNFNDRWFRSSLTQHFRADMGGGIQRCMNVVTGGAVKSATCASGTGEDFPLSNVEWRGMGNMCATPGPNNSIIMNTCDGTSAQKWTLLDSDPGTSLRFDQIKNQSTGQCVSAGTTNGFVGDSLTLKACSTTDTRQRFAYPGQGVIGYGNFCMNVSGGVLTPGQPLGLWDGCTATPRLLNEVFTLVGNVKNQGQCMDATNRSQVSVTTCSSANVEQIWEYYL